MKIVLFCFQYRNFEFKIVLEWQPSKSQKPILFTLGAHTSGKMENHRSTVSYRLEIPEQLKVLRNLCEQDQNLCEKWRQLAFPENFTLLCWNISFLHALSPNLIEKNLTGPVVTWNICSKEKHQNLHKIFKYLFHFAWKIIYSTVEVIKCTSVNTLQNYNE